MSLGCGSSFSHRSAVQPPSISKPNEARKGDSHLSDTLVHLDLASLLLSLRHAAQLARRQLQDPPLLFLGLNLGRDEREVLSRANELDLDLLENLVGRRDACGDEAQRRSEVEGGDKGRRRVSDSVKQQAHGLKFKELLSTYPVEGLVVEPGHAGEGVGDGSRSLK